MTQDLLEAVKDRVALLTLNRPDRLNAMSRDMLDALPTARTPAAILNTIPGTAPGFFATNFRGTSDSVTICRMRRPRAAPSAVRIASSLRRAAVRPSIRLPRLAQAISSTNPTDASKTTSDRSISPTS